MNHPDKIKALRDEIEALKRKSQGINNAVSAKEKTLQRLEAERLLGVSLKSAAIVVGS